MNRTKERLYVYRVKIRLICSLSSSIQVLEQFLYGSLTIYQHCIGHSSVDSSATLITQQSFSFRIRSAIRFQRSIACTLRLSQRDELSRLRFEPFAHWTIPWLIRDCMATGFGRNLISSRSIKNVMGQELDCGGHHGSLEFELLYLPTAGIANRRDGRWSC